MDKPFGPFRLTAGTHSEDYPLDPPVRFTVDQVAQGIVVAKDGQRYAVSRNTFLMQDGKERIVYRGNRRTTPGELTPGDEVELAAQREFTRESEPFMSSTALDERFNSRDSTKFVRAGGQQPAGGGDELAKLRRENDELRERFRKLEEAQKGHPQQPGKKQLANA